MKNTLLSLLSLSTAIVAAETTKPNVILIFADDLGYGDLSCYGATKVQTPHIDKIASEGRRFTDAHSASAVCTPSRYGLLTGEYPFRANNGKGIWGPCGHTQSLLIDTKKLTLGELFKQQDYATAIIGKWHLGFGTGKTDWNKPLRPGPLELGFDYFFGVPKVNSGFPYVYVENDSVVGYDPKDPITFKPPYSKTREFPPEAGKKTKNKVGGAKKAHALYDDEKVGTLLTEKAVSWITENKEKPFFLYFPTTNIHHPFTPAPQFKGTSQAGLYGDFIHEFDWMIGQLMKCLDDNNLTENTLVIVTSDNGGMINRGGVDAFKLGHKQNGDLLGFKFGVWEGGQRVPFIAKWPGQADSMNVLEAFTGSPAEDIRHSLVLIPRSSKHVSIRKGKWMYIPNQSSGGFNQAPGNHGAGGPKAISYIGSKNSDIENGKVKSDAPKAQLYDLEADVNQTTNIHDKHPEVVKEMQALLTTKFKTRKKKK